MIELTRAEREELRQDLLGLQQELLRLLETSRESSDIVALEQPIGRLSRMDALQQQAMAKANRQAQEQRLAQIDAALLAIKQERYGACRRCEEPIGFSRLKVRPEAPFCRSCQGQLEKVG